MKIMDKNFSLFSLLVAVSVFSVFAGLVSIFGFKLVSITFARSVFATMLVIVVSLMIPKKRLGEKLVLLDMFLLYFLVGALFFLIDEVCFQYEHHYAEQSWVITSLTRVVSVGISLGVLSSFTICIDSIFQSEYDVDYFPRVRNIGIALMKTPGLWILIAGLVVFVFFHFSFSLNNQSSAIASPRFIFLDCLYWWSLIWIADCTVRSGKGTIVGASFFLIVQFLLYAPALLGSSSVIWCYGPNCGRILDRIVAVEILGSFAGC